MTWAAMLPSLLLHQHSTNANPFIPTQTKALIMTNLADEVGSEFDWHRGEVSCIAQLHPRSILNRMPAYQTHHLSGYRPHELLAAVLITALCVVFLQLQRKDDLTDSCNMSLLAGEKMPVSAERTVGIVKRSSPYMSPIGTDVCVELTGMPRPNPRSSRSSWQGLQNWSSSGAHAVPVLPQPEIPHGVAPDAASELIFGLSTWKGGKD